MKIMQKKHWKFRIARNIKIRNLKKKEKGLIDMQEDTDLHLNRCQGLNDDVTTTLSSEIPQKPPITRKDDFFMDGHQQKKTRIAMMVENKRDLNSSQILILHRNVQCLRNKLLILTILLQLDLKKYRSIVVYGDMWYVMNCSIS
jgi:hypothetical protein